MPPTLKFRAFLATQNTYNASNSFVYNPIKLLSFYKDARISKSCSVLFQTIEVVQYINQCNKTKKANAT